MVVSAQYFEEACSDSSAFILIGLFVAILFLVLFFLSCCERCFCVAKYWGVVTVLLFLSIFVILIYMHVGLSPSVLGADESQLISHYCNLAYNGNYDNCSRDATSPSSSFYVMDDVEIALNAYEHGFKLILIALMGIFSLVFLHSLGFTLTVHYCRK